MNDLSADCLRQFTRCWTLSPITLCFVEVREFIHLVHGGTQRTQSVQAFNVDFSAVSLPRHGIMFLESCHFGYQPIQLLYLLPVAWRRWVRDEESKYLLHGKLYFPQPDTLTIEQLEERSLCTSGALHSAKLQVVPGTTNSPLVHQKIVKPQGGSFTNGRKLRWLEMSETQGRQVAMLTRKSRETRQDVGQLWQKNVESLTKNYQVLRKSMDQYTYIYTKCSARLTVLSPT